MKTRITELLGIKYPIIQGAMGRSTMYAGWVATVCEAGGLGTLATVMMAAEGIREAIQEIRQLTNKPFAVNLLPYHPQYKEAMQVIIEEKPPIFNYGRGNPAESIEAAKSVGSLAMPTVGTVRQAVKAVEDGADAVIATGTEGGAHTSRIGTMTLVPGVVRAVGDKVPVVAGGGIGTPEQFAAALALGADGIEMGTRFIVTKEHIAHPNIKQALMEASEEDTWATVHETGRYNRGLLNRFRQQFVGLPDVPRGEHFQWETERTKGLLAAINLAAEGNVENGLIHCGQGIGLIDDMPTVQELIEGLVQGVEPIVERLRGLL